MSSGGRDFGPWTKLGGKGIVASAVGSMLFGPAFMIALAIGFGTALAYGTVAIVGLVQSYATTIQAETPKLGGIAGQTDNQRHKAAPGGKRTQPAVQSPKRGGN